MKQTYIYVVGVALFVGAFALPAEAHVPVLVKQVSLFDITEVIDPTLSQTYYGQMEGFPHTYEIRATEPFHLYTHILLPDIDSSKNNISGVIIKESPEGGRVIEIAALNAKDASWNTKFEAAGGDTYREGPKFEGDLEPGVYRIEVHTPDNLEKYVLVIGTREEMPIGYFELLRRIAGVKVFFEKSQFRVIESPFVYVPLTLIMVFVVGIFAYRIRRRRKAHSL